MGLFLLQQVTVPLVYVLAVVTLASLLQHVIPESSTALSDAAGLLVYVSPAWFGFGLGRMARRFGSAVQDAGRWIWVAPVAGFAVILGSGLFHDPHHALTDLFGFRGGAREEGIGAILVTLPTAACCFYSLGISRRISFTWLTRSHTVVSLGGLCVFMTLAPTVYGADEGQPQPAAALEKMVAMQRAWGNKMNSAGATLELNEISRTTVNGHAAVKYRMHASGLPEDKTYSLVLWQLGEQPQTNLSGATVDETGTVVCAGRSGTCSGNKPNDPVDLTMMGGLGETKRIGLVASDQKAKAFASVTPFPIRKADSGCTLEATLVTPNAEAVMISGYGFKPEAHLDIEIASEGEKQHPVATADKTGSYETVVLPFRKGSTQGRTQVLVRSESCHPTVSFSWGPGSYVLQ